jgi:hypothetical protein
MKYISFEVSSLVVSVILLDKFCCENQIEICIENIHRLFFVSLVIAIKYNEDLHYNNAVYAQIGGVKLNALSEMELNFLKKIEYKLFVDDKLFKTYIDRMWNC